MDLYSLRQGLAANAATITGLRTFPYAPDSINPPTFFVGEPSVTFDGAFVRGMDTVTFVCRILATRRMTEAVKGHSTDSCQAPAGAR